MKNDSFTFYPHQDKWIITFRESHNIMYLLSAPFNNMQTLKFNLHSTIFIAVNHRSGPLRKQEHLAHGDPQVMFMPCDWRILIPTVGFSIFCDQPVVAVILIDRSKMRKSLVGVQVQRPRVIEKHSKFKEEMEPSHFLFTQSCAHSYNYNGL